MILLKALVKMGKIVDFFIIFCYNGKKKGGRIVEKRTASQNLKSFSIVYIIASALYIIMALLCLLIPDIAKVFSHIENGKIMIIIGTIISVAINMWCFFLARRAADGKSKGTLYLIILIIGIASAVVNFFLVKGFSFLSLDSIIDLCGLYFLLQVRKEK
jgi:uncharacterized membrane protein